MGRRLTSLRKLACITEPAKIVIYILHPNHVSILVFGGKKKKAAIDDNLEASKNDRTKKSFTRWYHLVKD
jgi:hypothetical protein